MVDIVIVVSVFGVVYVFEQGYYVYVFVVVLVGVVGFEVWCEFLFVGLDGMVLVQFFVVLGWLIIVYGFWVVYLMLVMLYVDDGVLDVVVICGVLVEV